MPRLYKCKGMAGLYAPRALGLMAASRGEINRAHSTSDQCDCEPKMPLKRKKALTKKSALQNSFFFFFLMDRTNNSVCHSIVGSTLTYSTAVELKSWLKVLC